MVEQLGPQKMLEQFKAEAPLYAKMLPELPRLLFDFLQNHRSGAAAPMAQLLLEQKRTNRLLQVLVYGAVGFVLGLVVMQLIIRIRLF